MGAAHNSITKEVPEAGMWIALLEPGQDHAIA